MIPPNSQTNHGDPRSDLKEDSHLWRDTLDLMHEHKDLMLYWTFHGLRVLGASLSIEKNSLIFMFPEDEYDEERKVHIRKKYIYPYKDVIKDIFKEIALKHASKK